MGGCECGGIGGCGSPCETRAGASGDDFKRLSISMVETFNAPTFQRFDLFIDVRVH